MRTFCCKSAGPRLRQRIEEDLPAFCSATLDVLARLPRRDDELRIAIAVRLLAVGGQEIRPARPHVAGEVLEHHRDAVGLRVERREERRVVRLGDGFLRQSVETAELEDRIGQEMLGE
jgi:hypothetical protein